MAAICIRSKLVAAITAISDAIDDVVNEERLTMNTVAKSAGRRFNYTYDFGDNWQHEIVIEGKKPLVDGRGYPLHCREAELPP